MVYQPHWPQRTSVMGGRKKICGGVLNVQTFSGHVTMLTKHDVTKMICNITKYSSAVPVNLHKKDTSYMCIIKISMLHINLQPY